MSRGEVISSNLKPSVGMSSEREESPGPPPSREPDAAVPAAKAPEGALPHWHAEWGEGIAIAAHDLKTPLTIINGYVTLLTTGKLGPLTPRQEEVLRAIADNALRLQRFTDEFLTYYAVQSGVEFNFALADLNDCVAETYDIWAPQFVRKSVALYSLPGKDLPKLEFDYHKVQHLISNLLENALKFTPAGGSVWVQTEPYFWERRGTQDASGRAERRKKLETAPNCARVNVSDTGPGIAPENFQGNI